MNINPPHIVVVSQKARAFVSEEIAYPADTYLVCGELTVTPFWIVMKGHDINGEVLTGVVVPRENVNLIQDMTAAECEHCTAIAEEIAEALNGEEAQDS